ncbi:MAG: transcription antitermination factor NusB [Eubacteriales bacterium]|nr:transcription antitermination factor NusB [Eubacteriales bacterium]MDD4583707.1 transcription antitermination factor NusB [Eubacteriales bacterium]
MRRKEAREYFMQLLYQMDIQKDYSIEGKERFMSYHVGQSIQSEYFNIIFGLVTSHLSDIDKVLADCSENWKIDRIAKVDLAVLRLSVAEILYLDEIPVSVSINEAVELAKKFGGEDSGRFVNGILGKVARDKNG